MSNLEDHIDQLIRPSKLFIPSTVLLSLDRKAKGIYGWWFRENSLPVPAVGTAQSSAGSLLYVGVGPVGANSGSDLRIRLGNHISGNSTCSTLRRSLGCLLAEKLNLRFRVTRTSKGGKTLHYGLGEGEAILTAWMEAHASVCWVEHSQPWLLEASALQLVRLPLNVRGNRHCEFSGVLHQMRRQHFAEAARRYRLTIS